MIMGGFGIEMIGVTLQVILSFFGLLLLLALLVARKNVERSSRVLFFLYSLCCLAQVGLMVRAISQSFYRSLGADLPFFLWSVYGSICFLVGVAMFLRELRGKAVAPKFYTISFVIFAIVPWVGLLLVGRWTSW